MRRQPIDNTSLTEQIAKAYESGPAQDLRPRIVSLLDEIRIHLVDNRDGQRPAANNQIYAHAVLLRGILDVFALEDLVSDPNWIREHSKVEKVWERLCDAEDRVYAFQLTVRPPIVEDAMNFISQLADFFTSQFGPGVYVSPEIKAKWLECTICRQNIKACSHVPGVLYDGMPCCYHPRDPELLCASIVDNPEDPRCRIWPWQIGDNNISSVILLTCYARADFLHDTDWAKQT